MNKKLLPILVFLIIVIILFGTFLIFNFLLEKKEVELMSETGTIEDAKPFIKSNVNDISLVNIIEKSLNSFFLIPISHKPFENQLSKEEVLKVYKSTVMEFIKKGIILDIPDISQKLENEKGYVTSLETKLDENSQLDPLYSTWTIIYNDDDIDIYMKINAITGDVLRLSFNYRNCEEEIINNIKPIEEILEFYLEYLKLESLKTEIIKEGEWNIKCKLNGTNVNLIINEYLELKNYYLNINFATMVQ